MSFGGRRKFCALQAYAEVRFEALLGLAATLEPLSIAAQQDSSLARSMVLDVRLDKLLSLINDIQVSAASLSL